MTTSKVRRPAWYAGGLLVEHADLRQPEVRRDAQEAHLLARAERIGAQVHARRDVLGQRLVHARPLDGDAQLVPGRAQHAAVQIVPGSHRLAVDGDDLVARP